MKIFVVSIFVIFVLGIFGVDEIVKLPGLNFDINFKHYSGYLQVSETNFLHYWFVESQSDPSNDPIIFWYNGGPMCSSLQGILKEMGPYLVNKDGKTLCSNSKSWNKFASIVFIESPAGVGFSYSSDENLATDDELTAEENYEGIKQFFQKHPDFRYHSTFIMGESYGGFYVPMLTSLIIDGQKDFAINLTGIAIGNGMLSKEILAETTAQFLHSHGFIDEEKFSTFMAKCSIEGFQNCFDESGKMVLKLFRQGINAYNIYGSCENFPVQNSKLLSDDGRKVRKEPLDFFCVNTTDLTRFLNSSSVREALNIPQNLPQWRMCAIFRYNKTATDMTPFIKKILDSQIRVLLLSGDSDAMCNFMMARKFCGTLGLPILENEVPWKCGKQNGGFKTVYKGGLTFATIRGAGHMVPQYKPAESYHLMKQFVENQPI